MTLKKAIGLLPSKFLSPRRQDSLQECIGWTPLRRSLCADLNGVCPWESTLYIVKNLPEIATGHDCVYTGLSQVLEWIDSWHHNVKTFVRKTFQIMSILEIVNSLWGEESCLWLIRAALVLRRGDSMRWSCLFMRLTSP